MHKFRSPSRSGTGFSIKKESISAPIPHVEDDEFPIRTPGASIATPVGDDFKFPDAAEPRRSGVGDSRAEIVPEREGMASPLSRRSNDILTTPPTESSPVRKSVESVGSRLSISKPQRKKSTLKSVLGKLFGRKRKSTSPPARRKNSGDSRAPQHRSDPSALARSPITQTNSQQRSLSLPITEYNRALRSHSVVIDDFPLRASYQQNNESNSESKPVTVDGSFTRPRGATTGGHSFRHIKTPLYGDWTGLTPRPASSLARGSQTVSDIEDGEVGVAISHPNRRSRSLGELRDVVSHSVTRRRSDEIRYWRQSQEQGLLSPISSNKPDEEPIIVETIEDVQDAPVDPPQPFNFGGLGEMAGMKITQAASLESRVSQLENRMNQLERFIPQLQQTSFVRPTTANSELSLPKHGSPNRSILNSQPREFRSSSYGSGRPPTTRHNVSYQTSIESFTPRVEPSPGSFHHKAPRPLSTSTTIRAGPPSSSPTSKDGTLTNEHYAALLAMIQVEQSARLNLEDIVRDLQQEVLILRSSISAQHEGINGHFSRFSHDESEDEIVNHQQDFDGFGGEDEVFRTPIEATEVLGEDGVFGTVSGNRGAGYFRDKEKSGIEEKKRSVVGRTLSLGQITLKSQQKEVSTNF